MLRVSGLLCCYFLLSLLFGSFWARLFPLGFELFGFQSLVRVFVFGSSDYLSSFPGMTRVADPPKPQTLNPKPFPPKRQFAQHPGVDFPKPEAQISLLELYGP